jgi:hypothetical protein
MVKDRGLRRSVRAQNRPRRGVGEGFCGGSGDPQSPAAAGDSIAAHFSNSARTRHVRSETVRATIG